MPKTIQIFIMRNNHFWNKREKKVKRPKKQKQKIEKKEEKDKYAKHRRQNKNKDKSHFFIRSFLPFVLILHSFQTLHLKPNYRLFLIFFSLVFRSHKDCMIKLNFVLNISDECSHLNKQQQQILKINYITPDPIAIYYIFSFTVSFSAIFGHTLIIKFLIAGYLFNSYVA